MPAASPPCAPAGRRCPCSRPRTTAFRTPPSAWAMAMWCG